MKFSFLSFLLLFSALFGDELTFDPPLFLDRPCPCPLESNGKVFAIDLNNPLYENGLLQTTEGGVLRASGVFIQARNILYCHTEEKNEVTCEGNILVDFHGQVMIGERFFFDFNRGCGWLLCGVTSYFPWQIGAQKILLLEDGSLECQESYITTSEGCNNHDLALQTSCIRIDCNKQLTSSSSTLKLYGRSIAYFPSFKLDLASLKRPPIGVKFGWGGYLGPHISLRYHAFSYRDFKASLRLDGFLKHGLGVGIESTLDPKNHPLAFYTRNYWAHDLAIDDPQKRDRYRFQGSYYNRFWDNKTTVQARYDVVSDAQMAADYNHESFDVIPAHETKLQINHKEKSFISNLIVDVRVNSFQSVDQQLPTVEWNMHPLRLPLTSSFFENYLKVSNINFVTSHDQSNRTTEQAARVDIRPALYWPFYVGPFIVTPRVGMIGIGYSNSPDHHSQNQILATISTEATTSLYHPYSWGHHTLLPHFRYTHLSTPTSAFHEHFIFSIDDAYTRFDELRFGCKNLFFFPISCRPLMIDLWANSFFDPKNKTPTLPKSYLNAEWQLSSHFFCQMDMAVHYQKEWLDMWNTRLDWTLSENLALSLEYRQRSAFSWRKGDFYNFILDVSRNEEELLASSLSDKRRTMLATLFYRVNPDWTLHFTSRYGQHAKQERSYFEYEIASRAAIMDHWWLHFSYQKRESDHRFAFSLKLATKVYD